MINKSSKILVVGSGTMGSGIALVFANAGFSVNLTDVKQEYLNQGLEKIRRFLDGSIKRGKITEEASKTIVERINPVLDIEKATKNIQLVIEAIIENVEAKKELFMKLDKLCSEDVIFASNTSAISITELASVTNRAEKFVGLHFFNPPFLMKLVEVISGKKTAPSILDFITNLCDMIGKTAVSSKETPGFIVNRLLWSFLNESYKLLESGATSKENIDEAIKLGLNHPMGPFELSDYIGLDIMLDIGTYIASELGEEYKPANILVKLVKEGKLGRKTKIGFYNY
ncbi:MAG: 3-hydroxyacyl-CoA dehydrogenase family protein [Candidatus Heimdallarchaeaceae archaeon]